MTTNQATVEARDVADRRMELFGDAALRAGLSAFLGCACALSEAVELPSRRWLENALSEPLCA